MGTDVIGREAEQASVERFLDDAPAGSCALIIEGEAGIGKTTVWNAGVQFARARGYTVLSSRPAESETKFSFAALSDLLTPAVSDVLPLLPDPQREALEVALLLTREGRRRADHRTVGAATVGALRRLASLNPVILAIDDVQWLDKPSAAVLEFALRRISDDPVGVLVSARTQASEPALDPLALGGAFGLRLGRIGVGPMTVDHLIQLLHSRLPGALRRPAVVQIHRAAGGNPFFALEIAHFLVRNNLRPKVGEPMPVPESVGDALRTRLSGLPTPCRDALLVICALAKPTVEVVEAAVGPNRTRVGLRVGVDEGVIHRNGSNVTLSHPLIGSVVYAGASPGQRRDLHRRLADLVSDPEERARHLALSAEGPDEEIASELEAAAHATKARGAPDAAADLFEMALELTPAHQESDRWRRLSLASNAHFVAGDMDRAARLLEEASSSMPRGPHRARVLWRLGAIVCVRENYLAGIALLEQARSEAGDDRWLRAWIEYELSWPSSEVPAAARHARACLGFAEGTDDPNLLATALSIVAFREFQLGNGIHRDLMARALEIERAENLPVDTCPSNWWAQMLKRSDDLEEARFFFHRCRDRALETGHDWFLPITLSELAEMECWAGDWDVASTNAAQACDLADQTGQRWIQAHALASRALVSAHRGRVDDARRDAQEGLELARRLDSPMAEIENTSVLGFLELSVGNPEASHRWLGELPARLEAMGVDEPGYERFVPDLLESLVALNRLPEAKEVLGMFEERAHRLDRPWALAAAARSRALLNAAMGDDQGAHDSAQEAVERHQRLGWSFDLGRALLVTGVIARRARQKRPAKEVLERALEIFDKLGAALWARKARLELARIGGRAPAPLALTPTERRVADLAAEGRTNREVARELFMSAKTVEWNLTRIYRKLGVRSRTELASRIAGRPPYTGSGN